MGDFKKNSEKNFQNEIFEHVTVPKNVNGGTLWDFLTSIVLQNIKKVEGETLGGIQKASKKVA